MKKSKIHWDELEIGTRPSKATAVWPECTSRFKAQAEAMVFAKQLTRTFGVQKNTKFIVKVCKIDFNNEEAYIAAVFALYDANDWDANAHVFHVEDNLPEYWDELSLAEIEKLTNI